MHVVRRGDSELFLDVDAGDFVNYDFEIIAPLSRGGEVLMGREVHVFAGEIDGAADAEMSISYSHDFGATFQDRGTTSVVPAGGVLRGEFPALGTNMRFTFVGDPLAVGLAVILNTSLHLT